MRTKWRGILIALLTASLVFLAGCQQTGLDVTFELIEQNVSYSGAMGYPDGKPLVILLTTHDEISQIEEFISQAALEKLNALDFQQYVVIAVFRGLQGGTGYPTVIERITLRDDQATVDAQFWVIGEGRYAVGAPGTSSYHLVKVRRDAGISHDTTLHLKGRLVTLR